MKKPSQEEEEYFAREDAVRRHAFAVEKARQTEQQERERIKQLHYMKCPKCGFDLEAVKFKGLVIDKCFHCNGSWLDPGELEQLAGHDRHLLSDIVALFKR